MKTIVILLSLLFTASVFPQTGNHTPDQKNPENHRVSVKSSFLESKIISAAPAITPYAYDSIRPLTETNTPYQADAFPWISADGLRLYYTSEANSNQLMFTQRPSFSSYFSSPTVVPISIPNPSSYWLSNNELDVYICNDSLYFSHRNTTGSAFGTPVLIHLTQQPYANITYRDASLNNSQNTLYLSAFNGTYLGIFEFSRTSPTSFAYTKTLPTPQGYTAITGQLSKDELIFYLSAQQASWKGKLYQLSRSSPADSFSTGTFKQIQNINDTSVSNTQPSMSNNLDWVAFVRASSNLWSGDDLFIAYKGVAASVYDLSETRLEMRVFPNPASSSFTVQFNKWLENIEMSIYNIQGEKIRTINNISGQSISLQRADLRSGIYFMKLIRNNKTLLTDKLIILDN